MPGASLYRHAEGREDLIVGLCDHALRSWEIPQEILLHADERRGRRHQLGGQGRPGAGVLAQGLAQ